MNGFVGLGVSGDDRGGVLNALLARMRQRRAEARALWGSFMHAAKVGNATTLQLAPLKRMGARMTIVDGIVAPVIVLGALAYLSR